MLNKPVLPFVEIMATQACNISCSGCTNYSDLPHKGYTTWAQAAEQITPWIDRLDILDFGIIGGEPLLNPDIRTWLINLRQLLPQSQLRFTTNGLLLSKNLDLVDLCYEIGNVVFKITNHTNTPDIEEVTNYILNKFQWDTVVEYGIKRYKTTNNLRFQLNQPKTFIKTFRGNYQNMHPYNSDPTEAFSICCQQTCPLLYNGRLYKCSTSALLNDVLARFNNPNYSEWTPYILPGIASDCTDAELNEFINNFGKPHSICRQCPTSTDTDAHLVHLTTVSRKKYV